MREHASVQVLVGLDLGPDHTEAAALRLKEDRVTKLLRACGGCLGAERR